MLVAVSGHIWCCNIISYIFGMMIGPLDSTHFSDAHSMFVYAADGLYVKMQEVKIVTWFPHGSSGTHITDLSISKILSILTKQTFRHHDGLPSGIVLCFIRLHLKECSQLCSTGTLHEWIGALHFPTVKMILSDVVIPELHNCLSFLYDRQLATTNWNCLFKLTLQALHEQSLLEQVQLLVPLHAQLVPQLHAIFSVSRRLENVLSGGGRRCERSNNMVMWKACILIG